MLAVAGEEGAVEAVVAGNRLQEQEPDDQT